MIKKYSYLSLPPIEQLLEEKVVGNNSIYELFDDMIGAGILDGGCAILALTLQRIYGGSLYGIAGYRTNINEYKIDHVLLRLNNKFYDGDGAHSKGTDLLKYWEIEEGVDYPKLVEITSLSELDSEIPVDKKFVDQVERYLRR